jgi:cytochrome oxidase Cu insertion factor (SCO1/SenC/PrrC family)
MPKKMRWIILLCLVSFLAMPVLATAALKGACGSKPAAAPSGPAVAPAAAAPSAAPVQKVIRPLERAINFELEAVVGNDIKTISLEDYKGKWRVVCFYPADFTFV